MSFSSAAKVLSWSWTKLIKIKNKQVAWVFVCQSNQPNQIPSTTKGDGLVV
jgi:hypothetical protein